MIIFPYLTSHVSFFQCRREYFLKPLTSAWLARRAELNTTNFTQASKAEFNSYFVKI